MPDQPNEREIHMEKTLRPGRKLDKLFRKAVFGPKHGDDGIKWSASPVDTLWMIEWLCEDGDVKKVRFECLGPSNWECTIDGETNGESWYCEAEGETLSHAFSLAYIQEQPDESAMLTEEDVLSMLSDNVKPLWPGDEAEKDG